MNLSVFDWISPAQAVASAGRPISCYWGADPPAHYEAVLKRANVETLGRVVAASGFIIMVAAEDVARAREILAAAGAWLA